MAKEVNVLIAGSGNVTGMNIIRALVGNPRINVCGCDFEVENPSNQWCETLEVPKCASENYPNRILEIIQDKKITHIIASNDHDVRALSKMMLKHGEIMPILNGFFQNILYCLDKKETIKLFKNAGVNTPCEVLDRNDYPYVLRKETMGNHQKYVYIIKSEDDKKNIPEEHFLNGIMTRYVTGIEYTIDVLCDSNSEVVAVVPRRRINVVGGMVHHAKIENENKLIGFCKTIAKSVGLVGMNCIQCIVDGDNYNFIEINPRPGSGIDLTIASGINMPLIWIQQTLGEKVIVPTPAWGLQMKRYYSGYYYR